MSEFKVGDHVRVTFEGEFTELEPGGNRGVRPDGHAGVFLYETHALRAATSIEKIERPVEVFGPGDLVRRKGRDWVYALAPDGYVRLHASADEKYSEYGPGYDADFFTSEHFERVEL